MGTVSTTRTWRAPYRVQALIPLAVGVFLIVAGFSYEQIEALSVTLWVIAALFIFIGLRTLMVVLKATEHELLVRNFWSTERIPLEELTDVSVVHGLVETIGVLETDSGRLVPAPLRSSRIWSRPRNLQWFLDWLNSLQQTERRIPQRPKGLTLAGKALVLGLVATGAGLTLQFGLGYVWAAPVAIAGAVITTWTPMVANFMEPRLKTAQPTLASADEATNATASGA